MRITFTKGKSDDRIGLIRANGTAAGFAFPHKGPTPHDAFHYFVERELGLTRGFWGLVADGLDPADVGAMAAAGGHASAKRACNPDAGIVELLQAERLVECFEAESWSRAEDNDGIRAMATAGWTASLVPPLEVTDRSIAAIRRAIAGFAGEWAGLPIGGCVTLDWAEDGTNEGIPDG